jgi:hypothetical protein
MQATRPVAFIEDLKSLGRFRARMAEDAYPVNVARMMYDRAYAYDRLSLAHGSADETLRQLAMQLFARYGAPRVADGGSNSSFPTSTRGTPS